MALTFMAVHAHPDDEATSTGGVLARYGAEGLTTIVVTCTDGALGDMPGGIKPGEEGHIETEVVAIRSRELKEACDILQVTHLEEFGYRDSGMADWEHKGHPEAFCNVPIETSGARLIELFEKYRPDVVVTYDEESVYNHPDHIRASQITAYAVEQTNIPRKSYITASMANRWQRIREIMEKHGVEMPSPPQQRSEEVVERMQAQEARITTAIDVTAFSLQKMRALRAHASQIQSSFWSRMPDEAMSEFFSGEYFIRVRGGSEGPDPEDDLFAGLR